MRFIFGMLVLGTAHFTSIYAEERGPSAAESLKKLKEGNQRFTEERVIRPNQTYDRVMKVSSGQHPFVSILSCSDSRVPPEMLFDQGFGDLFVVRVAGNVADTDEIGSLEYGVGHLATELLVVLGHSKCGAVTAVAKGATVNGLIPALIDNIIPAVKKAKAEGQKEDALINRAIELNVFQSIQDLLTRSNEIRHLIQTDRVTVVGAVYDLSSGQVRWIGEHPDQTKILKSFSHDHGKHPVNESSSEKSAEPMNSLKPLKSPTDPKSETEAEHAGP